MDETGKRKLSKRHGAKPILEYKEMGILPSAMINFLATIGWNDGTEQEIYTVNELIQKFSLDRVQRSGGVFDEKRLIYLNGAHIRRMDLDKLYGRLTELHDKGPGFWPKEAFSGPFNQQYRKAVLALVQERMKFFSELPELTRFFFVEPTVSEELFTSNKQLKKLSAEERTMMLKAVSDVLADSDFSETDLEERLRGLVEKLETKPGILFGLIRAQITGSNIAPGLFETMRVLGKDVVMKRLG